MQLQSKKQTLQITLKKQLKVISQIKRKPQYYSNKILLYIIITQNMVRQYAITITIKYTSQSKKTQDNT